MSTFVTAEIGINHNGDVNIAKKLIDTAVIADCNAVKFRKRTADKGDSQMQALEFGREEYDEIDAYCREKGIEWYASAWDVDSQLFLQKYDLKYNKIASAMLTNDELLETVAKEGRYTFVATGMSTFEEIDHAVEIFRTHECPFELMHCNSTYPMISTDANLRLIQTLRERYQCNVGYSGHEIGTLVSTCAVAFGATSIERHITLDKKMEGKYQRLAIEPYELWKLVKDIRETELIMGTGEKVLTDAEMEIRKKMRG